MSAHRDYVQQLKASIRAEDLALARSQISRRRRKKATTTLAKGIATIGGIGLGVVGIVALGRATRTPPAPSRPLLAKR